MSELKRRIDRVRSEVEQGLDVETEWQQFRPLVDGRRGDAQAGGNTSAVPSVGSRPPAVLQSGAPAPGDTPPGGRAGRSRPPVPPTPRAPIDVQRPRWAINQQTLVGLTAAVAVTLFVGTLVVLGSRSNDPDGAIVIDGTDQTTQTTVSVTSPPPTAATTAANSVDVLASQGPVPVVPEVTVSLSTTPLSTTTTTTTTTTSTTTTTTTTTVAPKQVPPVTSTTTTTSVPEPAPQTTTTTIGPVGTPKDFPGYVSYSDPPDVAGYTSLGVVPTGERPTFAVGDLGVAVLSNAAQPDGAAITVFDADGGVRGVPTPGVSRLIAYGPSDVAYVVVDGQLGAMPLSGPKQGRFIAAKPQPPAAQLADSRDGVFGHARNGIVNRATYPTDRVVAMRYVGVDGRRIALDSTDYQFLRATTETLEQVDLASNVGRRWKLTIDRSPNWKNWWPKNWNENRIPHLPPAPTADGFGVFWTQIGPWSSADRESGQPTQWVIAHLYPFGSMRWWSVPDGWQVVASDRLGTVIYRPAQGGAEVGLLHLPYVAAVAATTTTIPN